MPHLVGEGASIRYRVSGTEGRPWVTLSHSLAGDLTMWDGLAAALAPDFRVLQYDTRGHGESRLEADAHPEGFTLGLLADDVVRLWDRLGAERSHFIGLSLGGMTGMDLGLRHANRLDRLILCDCRADAGSAFQALWADRTKRIQEAGPQSIAADTLERWFTPGFRDRNPELMRSITGIVSATSTAGYLGCVKAVERLQYGPRLREITTPTMMLVGADDGDHPALMQEMSRAVPGSAYVEVPDAAHVPNIEQPAAFETAIRRWLA